MSKIHLYENMQERAGAFRSPLTSPLSVNLRAYSIGNISLREVLFEDRMMVEYSIVTMNP